MKNVVSDIVKDAPIPATATLQLLGYPLPDLILWLTFVWAVWRIAEGVITLYWKWKDRYGSKH